MMERVVRAARNWLEIKHPQAKTFAAQAEALGLSSQLWHQLATGGKGDVYLSTAIKILDRIGGDFIRALPDYRPEVEVAGSAKCPKRLTLPQALARIQVAEAERREPVALIGEIAITGQVVLEREKATALDLCLRDFPLYHITDDPTLALRRRESIQPFIVETWFFLRSLRSGTRLWSGAHVVSFNDSGDPWLCEVLTMSEPDTWVLRPSGLHHTGFPLVADRIKGLVIGTLSADWPSLLEKELNRPNTSR